MSPFSALHLHQPSLDGAVRRGPVVVVELIESLVHSGVPALNPVQRVLDERAVCSDAGQPHAIRRIRELQQRRDITNVRLLKERVGGEGAILVAD